MRASEAADGVVERFNCVCLPISETEYKAQSILRFKHTSAVERVSFTKFTPHDTCALGSFIFAQRLRCFSPEVMSVKNHHIHNTRVGQCGGLLLSESPGF